MPANLTPERLAALRALCQHATPGKRAVVKRMPPTVKGRRKWRFNLAENQHLLFSTINGGIVVEDTPGGIFPAADDNHVAAFDPTTCEALLDAADDLARVREERDKMRLVLKCWASIGHHEDCGYHMPLGDEPPEDNCDCPMRDTAALVGGKE